MDAPARRGHTRCLRRACTASAVRRAGTADRDSVGLVSRACGTFDPKARPCTLAAEGGAPRDDCRARSRTRLPRGKPTRAVEAWGGCWIGTDACGAERSSQRLQPAAAFDRGAAVRELKR